MKKWNILSSDSGVSEVIGTILLLGISVTLFSVVYITVLSFPGSPSIPYSNIALSHNDTSLILTNSGGEPLSLNSKIKIIIDDESYICDITEGLNAESEQDKYWGFGEQFLINFSEIPITFDSSGYNITVMVIDVDSNSLVLSSKNSITNRPPIIGSPLPYNTSRDVSIDISQITIMISDPDNDVFNWWINCSNGQSAQANGASNGIKTLSLSRLKLLTPYTFWVNATDPTGSGQFTHKSYTFITEGNKPPVYDTPSPLNVSTENSLSFSWSIPIHDREGDTFLWTIQCNNGQTNSSVGQEINGTKTLVLSDLAYSTTYKIWVNATDPTPAGSGLWTRRWYTFTTVGNNPPTYGLPSPPSGSTGNPLSLTWSIPVNDTEGNIFNWTIECNNGQNASGTYSINGTKSFSLSGLAYSTTYTIWVNATDPIGSGLWNNRSYTFTTKANNRPEYGTPTPANGSTGNPLSLTWRIPINDPEGNLFNWTIQCNGYTASGQYSTNGTKSLTLSGLSNNKWFKVWVNATDPIGSGLFIRRWYTFKT